MFKMRFSSGNNNYCPTYIDKRTRSWIGKKTIFKQVVIESKKLSILILIFEQAKYNTGDKAKKYCVIG